MSLCIRCLCQCFGHREKKKQYKNINGCRSTIKSPVIRDSVPFKLMDSEGFREIVDPIATALGIAINARNIKFKVAKAALKNCSASKQSKRTAAGTFRLDRSADVGFDEDERTAYGREHKKELLSALTTYSCNIQQVSSITIDNGNNFIKCVSLLESDQDDSLVQVVTEKNLESLTQHDTDDVVHGTFRCVRYASHTLQVRVFFLLKYVSCI